MNETVRKLWNLAAWIFAGTGIASGIVFLRIPWVQRFDFDILGFAWLLMNSAKLGAFVIMVMCLSFAASLWFRIWLNR